MKKSYFWKGLLTCLAALIASILSYFFSSCSASSHMELKHSADSLIIRKDGTGTITKVMFVPSNKFLYYSNF